MIYLKDPKFDWNNMIDNNIVCALYIIFDMDKSDP